jgi:hypothetical protein
MSDRAVTIVSTYDEAMLKLLTKSHSVAFVVYDPGNSDPSSSSSSSSSSVEAVIDASGASEADKAAEKMIRTRIFGEVARKMQARASFGLLSHADATPEDVRKFFLRDGGGGDAVVPTPTNAVDGGFVARIEEGVPTRVYDGELSVPAMSDFVAEYNLATVLELSGQNFRFVSRRGKSLAIAVYDPDRAHVESTDGIERELKRYAISGPHRDEYVFAKMDGKKWDKFLGQFHVRRENLPEFFVVDVPSRMYWQDSSVRGISDFISGVRDGTIASRESEGKSRSGLMDGLMQAFVNNMPWSLGVLFVLFVGVFMLALRMGDSVYGPNAPAVRQRRPLDDDGSNKKDR